MPFPAELITMFGSLLMGIISKAWGMKLENQKLLHEMAMERQKVIDKSRQKAREVKSKGFQWTRRIIALSVTGAVLVLPILAVAFGWTDQPVTVGWTEMQGGFWPFTSAKEVFVWKTLEGMVITPLHTHVMSAIIGLYFGGSLVGHNR